jgi:hypothetical protein
VCNGICPGGEECVGFETIFPSNVCACIPMGSTPCGGSVFCGGVCPPGTECNALAKSPLQGGYRFCGCSEPAPCGGCPCGYACALIPPLGCLPPSDPIPFCTGDSPYPVCGGSCAGGECRALRFLGAFEDCVCVRPEFCDVACGAGSCPTGMVCELDSHCNCSCAAP